MARPFKVGKTPPYIPQVVFDQTILPSLHFYNRLFPLLPPPPSPYFPILILCLMSFTIILSFNFGSLYIQRKSELETHFPDLKCVPNLERVLENKNALTILSVLFKQFPFRSVLLLIVPKFLRTRSKRSFFSERWDRS